MNRVMCGLKFGADLTILTPSQPILLQKFAKKRPRNPKKNPGSADPVNHAPAHALSRRKSAFIFAKQVEVIHSFLVEQWDCYLAWSGSSERRLHESCMQRTRVKLVRGSWKSNEWLLTVLQHLLEDRSTSIVAL